MSLPEELLKEIIGMLYEDVFSLLQIRLVCKRFLVWSEKGYWKEYVVEEEFKCLKKLGKSMNLKINRKDVEHSLKRVIKCVTHENENLSSFGYFLAHHKRIYIEKIIEIGDYLERNEWIYDIFNPKKLYIKGNVLKPTISFKRVGDNRFIRKEWDGETTCIAYINHTAVEAEHYYLCVDNMGCLNGKESVLDSKQLVMLNSLFEKMIL